MVLSNFFENPTEAEVRDLLGRPQLGIALSTAHTRLVEAGFKASLDAIVLSKITSRQVSALDPLIGPHLQRYGLQTFELAWKLSGKEALVIESPPDIDALT
jgi:hypothetical protein